MNYAIYCLLLLLPPLAMAKESGEWPKLDDNIPVPNESAEYFVNNGPFGTGNSTSGNVVNGRAKRHEEIPGGLGKFGNNNAGPSSSLILIKELRNAYGKIFDYNSPSSEEVALLLSALEMESIGPDQISEEYCPKLEHRVVAGHVQRQREQLMTFLNGDAYELIEAGSKLIAKIVDSCGVKEENKISIEIMQTVQNNFLKPILEHIWAGWKYLAIAFIVLFVLSLCANFAQALIHFGHRGK